MGRDLNELFAAFCEWVKVDEAHRGCGHLELWTDGCGRVGGVFMVDICFDNPEDGISQLRARGSVPGGSPTQERRQRDHTPNEVTIAAMEAAERGEVEPFDVSELRGGPTGERE